jgi:hypothetical protein
MRHLLLLGLSFAVAVPALCQFDMQNSGTMASLRGIDSVGGGVAWASGTEGTVLRTMDGGKHWEHCVEPPDAEKLDFRGVQAFDENTALVMSSGKGELSRLYKTVDGCRTWKLVFMNPDKDGFWDALSMAFPPTVSVPHSVALKHLHGYLLGDPVNGHFSLFMTSDGGDTWTPRVATKRGPKGEGCQVDEFAAKDGEATFAASNESLYAGGFYFQFVTGGADTRIAYNDEFSLDGALCHESSHYITLPIVHTGASTGAFAMSVSWQKGKADNFPDSVVIVGGDYTAPDSTVGNAAYISHFEHPWRTVGKPTTPPHGYRSAVVYDVTSKTWITVGPNGTDISVDDGRNWRALRPVAGDAPDADKDWNALSLPFVVGPKGRIGMLRGDELKALSAVPR